MAQGGKRVLALFDVDGTLTAPRKVRGTASKTSLQQLHLHTVHLLPPPQKATDAMLTFMQDLRKVRVFVLVLVLP